MKREQFGEYGYWCKGVKGYVQTFFLHNYSQMNLLSVFYNEE